jgi:mercuric ion transport protein
MTDQHQTRAGRADRRLLRTGIIGSAIVALCCFTPVLVLLLGALGLSAVLGWLDFVLFPALAFFIGLTVFALRRSACNTP